MSKNRFRGRIPWNREVETISLHFPRNDRKHADVVLYDGRGKELSIFVGCKLHIPPGARPSGKEIKRFTQQCVDTLFPRHHVKTKKHYAMTGTSDSYYMCTLYLERSI